MSANIALLATAGLAAFGLMRGRGSRKLEGFERIGTLPRASQVHAVSRGIYSPRAEEIYTERLKTARLPLYIVLGGGITPEDEPLLQDRAKQLAAQGYTVLLLAMPIEQYLGEGTLPPGSSEADRAFARERARTLLQLPRGEFRKVSPMTPFTLLHRMGDEMRKLWWSSMLMEDVTHLYATWSNGFMSDSGLKTLADELVFGSVGVNTLAGRSGLLRIPETISDLWAKYVLTGRIEFDPEAKPKGRDWRPVEQEVRSDMHKALHRVFPQLLERARGKVIKVSSL